MDTTISIRLARPDELSWINARYAEIRFVPSTTSDTLVIAEVAGRKAGVGRVVTLDEHNAELGGILVLKPFRGRGVAGEIVRDLLQKSRHFETVFCLPFGHLRTFYENVGFRDLEKCGATPPEHLMRKLAWCLEEYEETTTLLARMTPGG